MVRRKMRIYYEEHYSKAYRVTYKWVAVTADGLSNRLFTFEDCVKWLRNN